MQIETLPQLEATFKNAQRAMIERCNEQGLTQSQAARKLGVTRTGLHTMITRHGIIWRVIRQGTRTDLL